MKKFIKYLTESVDPLETMKKEYNRYQVIGCRDLSGSLKKPPMKKRSKGNLLAQNLRASFKG